MSIQLGCVLPPFNGKLVKINEEQREALEETISYDAEKLKQVDTFCKTLDTYVSDVKNASDSAKVTMEFDNSNKIQGLRCKLKYAVDGYYVREKFPELLVKVAEPPFRKIQEWLQANNKRVDGKDKVIAEINEAIKRSPHIDFSYQGILPYPVRQDFTEFDKEALKTLSKTMKDANKAITAACELDSNLKGKRIMFNLTGNQRNEYMNGSYERPDLPKTTSILTVDLFEFKGHHIKNILQDILPDKLKASFDDTNEGMLEMCQWLQTNLIDPANQLVRETKAEQKRIQQIFGEE